MRSFVAGVGHDAIPLKRIRLEDEDLSAMATPLALASKRERNIFEAMYPSPISRNIFVADSSKSSLGRL